MRSRVPAMQICPEWKVHTCVAPLSAASRGASAKTTCGDFPPSSRSVRFKRRAAVSWISRPTVVLPVNEIMSTSGDSTSARPTSGPEPQTKFTTPGGNTSPTMRQSSATPSGSTGAGFTTTVLPHASAGPILPAEFVIGKFDGVMHATTPIGSRTARPVCTVEPTSRGGNGSCGIRPASSAYFSSRSGTAPTCCAWATPRTAPVSAIVRSTSELIAVRNASAAFFKSAPRAAPDIRGHGPCSNASRAARAAASTWVTEHSGARPAICSVAGSTMGYVPRSAGTHAPPIRTLSITISLIVSGSGGLCLQLLLAVAGGGVDAVGVELREDVLAERLDRVPHVLLVDREGQRGVDELIDPELFVHPDDGDDLVGQADLTAAGAEAGLQLLGRCVGNVHGRRGRRHALRARDRIEPVEKPRREVADLRPLLDAAAFVT